MDQLTPHASQNLKAAVPEKDPDAPTAEGWCHNCAVPVPPGEAWCSELCRREWRRFQRKA